MNPHSSPAPAEALPAAPLLTVTDLSVQFGHTTVVDSVSFTVSAGEVLGIAGESGSGKSMTALALMGLLPRGCRAQAKRVDYLGEDLLLAGRRRLEDLRGASMAMIFQEPMTALNPVLTVGDQIDEVARRHLRIGRHEARDRSIEALRRVGIPAADQRIEDYPHQLSGGMRQRVMIAMALVCRPKLLIADEPTTALDVTVQAQILELIQDLQAEYRMGIIMISHDLGVMSSFADRIMIMYCGRAVEEALVQDAFDKPMHPYSEGLLASIPTIEGAVGRLQAIEGTVPSPFDLPPGCSFAPRCSYARPVCASGRPELAPVGPDHRAACIRNTGYTFAR